MSDWNKVIENFFSDDEIQVYKKQYAKLLLRYNNNTDEIFKCTEFQLMFNGNLSCQLYAHNNWFVDKEVKQYTLDIQDLGYEGVLPSKEEVALEILEKARRTYSTSESVQAYKLYLELTGALGKSVETSNVQNVIYLGEDSRSDQWEESLLKNQKELQDKANSILNNETKH